MANCADAPIRVFGVRVPVFSVGMSARAVRAYGFIVPALLNTVAAILLASSQPEMHRVHTRRIVAGMANIQLRVELALGRAIHESSDNPRTAAKAALGIAQRVCVTLPFPTARGHYLDLRQHVGLHRLPLSAQVRAWTALHHFVSPVERIQLDIGCCRRIYSLPRW